MTADPRLIVPLDLPTRAAAEAMVETLGDAISFYKIGLQLLASGGMDPARDLKAARLSRSFSTGSCTTSARRSKKRPRRSSPAAPATF